MSLPMRHANGEEAGGYRAAQQDQVVARIFDPGRGGGLVAVDPFGNYQRAPVAGGGGGEMAGVVLAGQPISTAGGGQACGEVGRAVSGLSLPLHEKMPEVSLAVPTVPGSVPFTTGKVGGQHGVQLFMVNTPGMVKQESAGGVGVAVAATSRMKQVEGSTLYQDPGEMAKMRRIEARKERNRRAQRSFRQRQKSRMAALEGEVENFSTRLDGLKSSNGTLQANAALLQKVPRCEEQTQLLLQLRNNAHLSLEQDRSRNMYFSGSH